MTAALASRLRFRDDTDHVAVGVDHRHGVHLFTGEGVRHVEERAGAGGGSRGPAVGRRVAHARRAGTGRPGRGPRSLADLMEQKLRILRSEHERLVSAGAAAARAWRDLLPEAER